MGPERGLHTIVPQDAGTTDSGLKPKFEESPTSIEEAERTLVRAVKMACVLMEKNKYNNAEVVASSGSSMVTHLKTINEITDRKERALRLRKMHGFLKGVIEGGLHQDYEMFKVGFLGEYAVSDCFESLGYKVFSPTVEEDTHFGLDLWVDLGEPLEGTTITQLAVQVKTLSMTDAPTEIVFPLRSQTDVGAAEVITPLGDRVDNRRNLRHSATTIMEYSRRFDNVLSVVIILPSSESDYALFNSFSGQPVAEMRAKVGEEVRGKIGGKINV